MGFVGVGPAQAIEIVVEAVHFGISGAEMEVSGTFSALLSVFRCLSSVVWQVLG